MAVPCYQKALSNAFLLVRKSQSVYKNCFDPTKKKTIESKKDQNFKIYLRAINASNIKLETKSDKHILSSRQMCMCLLGNVEHDANRSNEDNYSDDHGYTE